MTGAESDATPLDAYQQSASRLFELLPPSGAAGPSPERYYKVTWNDVEPVIDAITLMSAEPTGARRQERYGQFNSAQFYIVETTADGNTSERFIWCDTGQQNIGTPIKPNLRALTDAYDYEQLTADSIVEKLAEQARSFEDYLALVQIMQQHGAQPVPSLMASINRLTYQVLQGGFDVASRDKLFELVGAMQSLRSDMPRTVQSYLISHALRAVTNARSLGGEQAVGAANRAAAVLEEAIEQGIIPDEPRTMDRILSNGVMYAYPFATELAYAKLQANPDYGSAKHIFGARRISFVIDYMVAIVETRCPALRPEIGNLLRNNYIFGREEGSPESLYGVLNGLVQLVADQTPTSKATIPEVRGLADAKRVFAYVLRTADTQESPKDTAQVALAAKSVDIVGKALAPLVRKRVGQTVADATVDTQETES